MAKPVIVAQLSDPHIGATWAGHDPIANLTQTVETAQRLPDPPDVVLLTGDLADNAAPEEYLLVRDLVSRLGAPVFALPGNHDDRDTLRRCFEITGEPGAPVEQIAEIGGLRIVLLDSTVPGAAGGELDEERLAWLDAALAAGPGRPTVVALHHPPLVTGSPAWDSIGLRAADRVELAKILARHAHVQLVLAGHVHRAIAARLDGRLVFAAPSTYVQALIDLTASDIRFGEDPPALALHVLRDGGFASYVQPVGRGR